MPGLAGVSRSALAQVARAARAFESRARGLSWGVVNGHEIWTARSHVSVRALGTAPSGRAMRPLHSVITQLTQTARARPLSRGGMSCAASRDVLLVHQPSAGGWPPSIRGACHRFMSAGPRAARPHSARYQEEMRKKNRQVALYMGGLTLFTISFTYLSVPL